MKEEIDWKKELLESKKFNNQFSKNILENGAKNYMQEIYMGYMYNLSLIHISEPTRPY